MFIPTKLQTISTDIPSYIVTDLMWTNLQKLIARGPIENDFSKYFLYQILVRPDLLCIGKYAN
jgi:hypothetical protein